MKTFSEDRWWVPVLFSLTSPAEAMRNAMRSTRNKRRRAALDTSSSGSEDDDPPLVLASVPLPLFPSSHLPLFPPFASLKVRGETPFGFKKWSVCDMKEAEQRKGTPLNLRTKREKSRSVLLFLALGPAHLHFGFVAHARCWAGKHVSTQRSGYCFGCRC